MASKRDYYEVLGLTEAATADQIKRAYRELAKKNHPDTNPGNKAAEERFKEISEAYYVLSDEKKRREYDAYRRTGYSPGGQYGAGQGFQGAQGFDFDEVLRMFRGAQGGGRSGGTRTRFGGGQGNFADIFSDLFGQSASAHHAREQDEAEADVEATLSVSKARAHKGGEVSFSTRDGKRITVKLPAGITTGKKLRLSRQGRDCPTCRHPGDLILTIKVE